MKNLFYKEIKLCLTPVVFWFVGLFPLMILIPNYPLFIAFIYICAVYPFIFLGANKGQPTNDLTYSVLLPIRRKDIIIGRALLLTTIQICSFILVGAISPLSTVITNAINSTGGTPIVTPGLGANAIVSVIGWTAIGFAIYDFVFFCFYYKKSKSIIIPSLLGILIFCVFMLVFTIILPLFINEYAKFFSGNIGYQFLFMIGAFIIAAGIKYLAITLAAKQFEKVDF